MASDVTLSWSDNSDGVSLSSTDEDGFRIYKSTTSSPSFPGDFTQIDSVGTDVESHTVSINTSNVTELAVTAYNSVGESDPVKTSVVWGGKPSGDVELGNRRNAKIPSAAAPAAENKASTPNLEVYRATASNPTFPDDYTLVNTFSGNIPDFTDENSLYGTDIHYAFVPELDGDEGNPTLVDTYIPPKEAASIREISDNTTTTAPPDNINVKEHLLDNYLQERRTNSTPRSIAGPESSDVPVLARITAGSSDQPVKGYTLFWDIYEGQTDKSGTPTYLVDSNGTTDSNGETYFQSFSDQIAGEDYVSHIYVTGDNTRSGDILASETIQWTAFETNPQPA